MTTKKIVERLARKQGLSLDDLEIMLEVEKVEQFTEEEKREMDMEKLIDTFRD